MNETRTVLGGQSYRTVSLNTVVIGSGAAGFNAALRLHSLGVTDCAIVTEGVKMGTSRNTGSDKQTYYKMNLCADYPDSPRSMAEDFFRGKCVDGDTAYVEASLSIPCFLNLCEKGVPFPVNRFGEYIGYKTDHDPRARATSAGPLTSKLMTECLEAEAERIGVKIYDKLQVISILKDGERVAGVLALNKAAASEEDRLVLFRASNVIIATGGPAGIYEDSVYPIGHAGSSGVAFEAGVLGKNLTEWQYGLASIAPRWNVSGTYMQVLPRFVSVDGEGNEYEFLAEYFDEVGDCLSKIFKKGYEWPFDCRKAIDGSSIIDLLVYREKVLLGRRVYLDFRRNPYGYDELPYDSLTEEAREYLEKAGACFGNPLERLLHMNEPAYDLYLSKGVDLRTEMLEIALCAQHNNGGLSTDLWWQTNVPGLYAAGEVAGTHGVYRPGGSALNAGQVGSMRAAQHIARFGAGEGVSEERFAALAESAVAYHRELCRQMLSGGDTLKIYSDRATKRMSEVGGAIRNSEKLGMALSEIKEIFDNFASYVRVSTATKLYEAYRLRDALISQMTYLAAMKFYVEAGGKSRGSAIYTSKNGSAPAKMGDLFRFELDSGEFDEVVEEVSYADGLTATVRPVRPLPGDSGFFENVWRRYREDKNVY